MANIKDIAQLAGVSVATVSKVLNGTGSVSEKTAENVMRCAGQLNYRPNLHARNLKTGHSRTIGIITEDMTVFNAAEIVDGVGACCDARKYYYILSNLRLGRRGISPIYNLNEYRAALEDEVDFLLSMQVDGIVYVSSHNRVILPRDGAESYFAAHPVPFVCTYCYSGDENTPSIIYDDCKAAREVTDRLLRLGHEKIGFIAGPQSSVHTATRLRGSLDALYEHGIPYNPELTINGDWGRDSGYEIAKTLIAAGVTAIFAYNDVMALGVIDYCNQSGIKVGEELSLFGFDNREISTVCRPALSTVALPLYEIGSRAAEVLINNLEGKEPLEKGIVMLDCKLIERDSTGKAVKDID